MTVAWHLIQIFHVLLYSTTSSLHPSVTLTVLSLVFVVSFFAEVAVSLYLSHLSLLYQITPRSSPCNPDGIGRCHSGWYHCLIVFSESGRRFLFQTHLRPIQTCPRLHRFQDLRCKPLLPANHPSQSTILGGRE